MRGHFDGFLCDVQSTDISDRVPAESVTRIINDFMTCVYCVEVTRSLSPADLFSFVTVLYSTRCHQAYYPKNKLVL